MADTGLQFNDIVANQTGLSRDQIATNAQALTLPNYSTPNTGSSSAISLDQLQSQPNINLPTPTPTASPLAGATASADQTSKSLQDYIKEITPAPTALDTQQQSLIDAISKLSEADTGRGAAQLSAEQAAGIPDLKKNLADINARILTKVAEANQSDKSYEQLIANLENPNNAQQQGIPMSTIIGQQAQVRKVQLAEHNAKAADLGVLQAFAQGLQGQLTAAQDSVNRAIDLRYADIEAELNAKKAQLDAIQPLLNKQEKIQADALARQYADQQQQIADEKQKAKDNINLAVQNNVNTRFANNRGEFFDVVSGVAYHNPKEFFQAAGVKSFEEAYARGLVTDISATSAIDLKQYPASYQEYLLAKQEGFTGNYNDYQTMDANRKAVRSTTNVITYNQAKDQAQTSASSKIGTVLAQKAGSDGYVSPSEYKAAKAAWVSDGYSSTDFDSQFGGYVNPADPQDYGLR